MSTDTERLSKAIRRYCTGPLGRQILPDTRQMSWDVGLYWVLASGLRRWARCGRLLEVYGGVDMHVVFSPEPALYFDHGGLRTARWLKSHWKGSIISCSRLAAHEYRMQMSSYWIRRIARELGREIGRPEDYGLPVRSKGSRALAA